MKENPSSPLGLSLTLLAALTAACPSSTPGGQVGPTCGVGTEQSGQLCVPVETNVPTCGPQTELDPVTNTCVSMTECGAGTTFNRDTNACEPLATCAPGTALDLLTGLCETVATCGPGTVLVGETCVTEVECGPGTVLSTSGACEAVEPCAPGTSFNTTDGVCESFLTCGDGQVEIDGTCLDDVSALADQAEVHEPSIDANDPALGGTPEALGTIGLASAVTFAGTIDRPRDLDNDGDDDQDYDSWTFEAGAGQWVSLTVQSDGLPQPAFVVRGPHGFVRESPMGYVNVAERALLLPFDGSYTIEVAPALHHLTGVPVGGPNAGYYGVVTGIAAPTATPLTLSAPGTPLDINGALLDTAANFYSFTAGDDTPVVVQLDGADGPSTAPAVIVAMSDGGDVISHTVLSPEELDNGEGGNWAAMVTVPGTTTHLFIDYVRSRGPSDEYAGRIVEVPVFEAGVLPTHGVREATIDVGLDEFGALRYSLSDVQVVELGLIPPCTSFRCPPYVPEVSVAAGYNPPAAPYAGPSYAHLGRELEHTLFFRHLVEQAVGSPTVSFRTITPAILDAVGASNLSASVSGDRFDLGPSGDEQWVVVQSDDAGYLSLGLERASGLAGADIMGPFGGLRRQVRFMKPDDGLMVATGANETSLVHLFNRDPSGGGQVITDWTFSADFVQLPNAAEVEPNDDIEEATDLGEVPVAVKGGVAQFAEDVFRVKIPESMNAGQALRLYVDTLTGLSPNNNDDIVQVLILDEAGQIYSGIPQGTDLSNLTDTSGIRVSSGAFVMPVSAGEVLYIRVRGQRRHIDETGARPADDQPYLLDLSLVDAVTDVEPNDDAMSAVQNNPLGALPATAFGWLDKDTDPMDAFAVTLDEDLNADESLLIEVLDLESAGRFELVLKDTDGVAVAGASGTTRTAVQAGGVPAGIYTLEVRGPAYGSAQPHYRIDASIAGRFEAEPNDAVHADDLGVLVAGGELVVDAFSEGEDVFLFSLDAPLAADAYLELELLGLTHSAALVRNGPVLPLMLFDGPDPAVANLIAGVDDFRATTKTRLSGTGPFALVQKFTTSNVNRYQIRVRHVQGARVENEPNDFVAEAVPGLPAVVYGNTLERAGEADVDLYTVTLDAPLGPGRSLEVRLKNTHDADPQSVTLIDPDGSPVDAAIGDAAVVSAPAAVAGAWTVKVEYGLPGFRQYHDPNTYSLSIDVVDAQ